MLLYDLFLDLVRCCAMRTSIFSKSGIFPGVETEEMT